MSSDDVIIAELSESSNSSATREFNVVIGATLAISLAFLFISAVYGDAFVSMMVDDEDANEVRVPVWERHKLPYMTSGDYGVALEVGPYELLPTENAWNSTHHFVEYTLPIEEGGAAPNGLISLAVWRPNVPKAFKSRSSLKAALISRKPVWKHLPLKFPEVGWARCSLTKYCLTATHLHKSLFLEPAGVITAWI